ncbi:MAG: hypothetical protein HUK24_01895 [Sphaerochaetaceae bacterium]|nr:hypothetical protein [Sphaerochaetaceae bacterium]
MNRYSGIKTVASAIILFFIVLLCTMLFHTCSIEAREAVEEASVNVVVPVDNENTDIVSEPVIEEPIIKVEPSPVIEVVEPVVVEEIEEPIVESIVEPTVTEEPVIIEDVTEVIAEEPVSEEPITEEPIIEEPIIEEPIIEESVIEEIPQEEQEVISEPTDEIEPEPVYDIEEEPEPEPVWESLGVPGAPDLDSWVPTEVKVENTGIYFIPNNQEVDWSLFVSSDAAVTLSDGTYYVALYVNSDYLGTIETNVTDGNSYFRKSDLEGAMAGILSDDYYLEFFGLESPYYSFDDFDYLGATVESYDTTYLELYLHFDSSKVPIQTISLSNSMGVVNRTAFSIDYDNFIEPAKFTFITNVNTYVSVQDNFDSNYHSISGNMSFANSFSFWNMTLSLPVSVSGSMQFGRTNFSNISYSIGNWNGYIDFPYASIRLNYGNVGSGGFNEGSPFGITIEKSYGYGTDKASGNQYEQYINLVEDSYVEVSINGAVVYSRNLDLGTYRLIDFAFTQGANVVEVRIHKISRGEDTSEDEVLVFEQNYDSSIMSKGESTWRFGISIPRIKTTANAPVNRGYTERDMFVIPALPTYNISLDKWYMQENRFLLSDVSFFWEQTVGLSNVYAQSHNFTFVLQKNDKGEYDSNFTGSIAGNLVTSIGSTRISLTGIANSDSSRDSLSINLSQSFYNNALKPLSLSGSYTLNDTASSFSINTGYSFSIGSVRTGLTLSTSLRVPTNKGKLAGDTKQLSWNGGISLSGTLSKKISFSLSTSINEAMNFFGTFSLSCSISGSTSANTSISAGKNQAPSANASMSIRPVNSKNNSFQFALSGITFDRFINPSLSGSWSHSADFYTMSLREQISNRGKALSTSITISSALAFADGRFGISSGIYSPFLLVVPEGAMKKAELSIASASDASASSAIKKLFGNAIYKGLSLYKDNNVLVYGSNASKFSSTGSFIFQVHPTAKQGFIAHALIEITSTVSGVIRVNDTALSSYSSPVFPVTIGEDGVSVVDRGNVTALYLFTDVEGRYIVSGIKAGSYMFDLYSQGKWYAVFFDVPEVENPEDIVIFSDFDVSLIETEENLFKYDITTYDDTYDGSSYITFDKIIDEDQYWDMLFTISDDDSLIEEWDEFDNTLSGWDDYEIVNSNNSYSTTNYVAP